jgi:hypothetical protein
MAAAARCPLLLSLCKPIEFVTAIRSSKIKLDFNQCPVVKSSKKVSKFWKKQWTAFQLGKQLAVSEHTTTNPLDTIVGPTPLPLFVFVFCSGYLS